MRRFELATKLECPDLDALLRSIDAAQRDAVSSGHREPWYFRGDGVTPDSELKPWIGRRKHYGGRSLVFDEVQERNLLNRFRRFAYAHMRPGSGDWEALFLARHYGLPTRIMDWSASPLVAAYFACGPSEAAPPEGIVWGILRQPEGHDIDVLNLPAGPLDLYRTCGVTAKAVKLIYPVYNSDRLTGQKGLFTWHSQPSVPLDQQAGESFDDDKLDISLLVKWPLAFGTQRTEILQKLHNFGVSQRTIFPDLEGITRSLWQTEVLFNGT